MEVNKENEKEAKVISRVFYLGGDSSFFTNIQDKFKQTYSSVETKFEKFYSDDQKIIQSYILKISELKPRIILIDFSQNESAMLHLARVWNRQNFYSKIQIIGLCDYKQSRSMIVQAVMTTISCVHIKSTEYESVIHSIALLAFPDKVQDHGFATAKLADPAHVFHPCKLSLINENFIRVESNLLMKSKQVIRLNTYWGRQKIIRSSMVMCVDQSQENIYYNYQYGQVFQMAHADPVEQTDNMTQDDFDVLQQKRQKQIEESRYNLKRWILSNEMNSRPKFLKAYVIDKQSLFYDLKPLSDTYSFVFRNQPFIINAKKELTNIKPQLIIFNLEDVDKETLESNEDIAHTFNDTRMFQHLVKTAKDVCKEQPPIIVVFNSGEFDSAYMQKVFNYTSILAVKEEMTLELTLKMAEMLKGKIAPHLPSPKKGDVYIDKSADLSYSELESDINLVACSETDLYFDSEEPVEEGTILRISLPVPMYITVVPMPVYSSITAQNYAIIHGIGEEERKELRRFINSIFFRDLESEKANAVEDTEKLKKEYLKKQEEDQAAEILRNDEDAAKALEEEKERETQDRAEEIIESLGDEDKK